MYLDPNDPEWKKYYHPGNEDPNSDECKIMSFIYKIYSEGDSQYNDLRKEYLELLENHKQDEEYTNFRMGINPWDGFGEGPDTDIVEHFRSEAIKQAEKEGRWDK